MPTFVKLGSHVVNIDNIRRIEVTQGGCVVRLLEEDVSCPGATTAEVNFLMSVAGPWCMGGAVAPVFSGAQSTSPEPPVVLPKGTVVKVGGFPFQLTESAVVEGSKENLKQAMCQAAYPQVNVTGPTA